jgi:c(7)-type cytochrome triheme protein
VSDASEKKSISRDARGNRRVRRWLSFLVIAAGCAGFVLTILFNSETRAKPAASSEQLMRAGFEEPVEPQTATGDFSKFSHGFAAHARLPCLLCHRRETNSPQPRLPGHTPCAGCHTQQFADAGNPICTICHTDVGTGAVKSFPSLKSFNVKFDHARHTGMRVACATCHRPQRNGVALSIPARLGAHATCFQCHSPRAQSNGRDISSCSTCHAPGRFARTPATARAYRVNFSHADHTRRSLNCADCHSVRAGASQGRQVTAPEPLMHRANPRARSCASCHNDKRAFGIENFVNCKRCHEGQTFRF